MFTWIKNILNQKSKDLNRIADSLDLLTSIIKNENEEMEKRIYESVYRRLSEEMLFQANHHQKPQTKIEPPLNKLETKKENDTETTKLSDSNPVVKILQDKKVSVTKFQNEVADYEAYSAIYRYMGDKYSDISRFLKKLKSTLNSASTKKICVKNWTDREISASCQLASMLYKCGMLEHYHYHKSPSFEMVFRASRNPKIINFLTGKWFELYITQFIEQNLRISRTDYSILTNPLIMLPTGKQFEMDIVLEINDKMVWMEIKSGEYKSYLSKYTSIGNLLAVEPENRFLILSDETEASCVSLSKLYNINILNLEMLKTNMNSIIRSISYNLEMAV